MLQTQSVLHEEGEDGGGKPNQMDGFSFSISAAYDIDVVCSWWEHIFMIYVITS